VANNNNEYNHKKQELKMSDAITDCLRDSACYEKKKIPENRVREFNERIRSFNVGSSDYAKRKIQPWDIWLEYKLDPWKADIIKRVLRDKPGEERRDVEKIMHICDEILRQMDAGER
jgi:hypothetical protein